MYKIVSFRYENVIQKKFARMARIRLSIFVVARNALLDKYNKIPMRSVGQWERKIGLDLSKHESHQITSFISTLIKIGQWDAGLQSRVWPDGEILPQSSRT